MNEVVPIEAAGNLPAKIFFELMSCGALGPGIVPTGSGRIHANGPYRGHSSLLAIFARLINAKKIVELGTGTAVGTKALMEACRYTGGHVWSIDLNPTEGRIGLEGDPRVTFITDDSASYALKWAEGPVDLVYVDGDHAAASALADMEAWAAHSPKLFLLDDTMDVNTPFGSPLDAAESFARKHGWTLWNIPIATGLCVLLPGTLNPFPPLARDLVPRKIDPHHAQRRRKVGR